MTRSRRRVPAAIGDKAPSYKPVCLDIHDAGNEAQEALRQIRESRPSLGNFRERRRKSHHDDGADDKKTS
jgi:hypothetical protein